MAEISSQTERKPERSEEAWGNPLHGASIAIRIDQSKFVLGAPIRLKMLIRNKGRTDVRLLSSDTVTTYRVIAFSESGVPVEKSAELMRAEESSEAPGAISRALRVLKPGDETTESFDLDQLSKLTKPGRYFVVVVRRLMSWDDGFLISNAVPLTIVADP